MSLEDSRDWYRALAEDIPVLVTRVSADGIVTYVNEASARLVGRPREEIVGTDFFQLAPPNYREQIKKAFASLTSCNDAACRLFGCYSREELLGISYSKLYRDPEEAFRTYNQVYKTGKPEKGLVLEMIRKDGSIAFGELSIYAYDAMTSKRPYNKKKTTEEAVEEIKKHSGSQFDPALVPVFLDVLNEVAE